MGVVLVLQLERRGRPAVPEALLFDPPPALFDGISRRLGSLRLDARPRSVSAGKGQKGSDCTDAPAFSS